MSKSTQEVLTAINRLKKDVVLRLQSHLARNIRGLKTSVGQILSSNNLNIEYWTDSDEAYLYVRGEP